MREFVVNCRTSIETIPPGRATYNRWSRRCKDSTHYREYTREEVEALVHRAGVTVVSYSTYGFVAPFLVRTIHFWLNMLPLMLGYGIVGQRRFMDALGRLLPQREREMHALTLRVGRVSEDRVGRA
jgi:hypothetical protein